MYQMLSVHTLDFSMGNKALCLYKHIFSSWLTHVLLRICLDSVFKFVTMLVDRTVHCYYDVAIDERPTDGLEN